MSLEFITHISVFLNRSMLKYCSRYFNYQFNIFQLYQLLDCVLKQGCPIQPRQMKLLAATVKTLKIMFVLLYFFGRGGGVMAFTSSPERGLRGAQCVVTVVLGPQCWGIWVTPVLMAKKVLPLQGQPVLSGLRGDGYRIISCGPVWAPAWRTGVTVLDPSPEGPLVRGRSQCGRGWVQLSQGLRMGP